jgi:hypothetical protein
MAKVTLQATADKVYRLEDEATLSQDGVSLTLPVGTLLIVPDGARIVPTDPRTVWH